MNPEELKARLLDLNTEAHTIVETARAEKRDLSVDETAKLDAILAESDRVKADIDRLEKLAGQTALMNQGAGRKTSPEQPKRLTADDDQELQPAPKVAANYKIGPKNGGFKHLGDYAQAVQRACAQGGVADPRLAQLASATTYGSEGSGADGGFAVPPDFRTAIMTTILGENSLLSRCDQITCDGNTFSCPVDETTPWQTTGGFQAYWDGEAQAATQSKPQLGDRSIKLNKLRALVPVTEELLEDAAGLDSYLRRKVPQKIDFKVNFALLQGTGVGMPLGVQKSPALITITKETSQAANTIVAMNIIKIWSRLYAPCRPNSVWLYNQEVEPQLLRMTMPGTDDTGAFVTGWGAGWPMYMPPGGLSGAPYGTLLGRPCIPTQACPALSSAGDIGLYDFMQFLALLKSGPNPRVDVSMHLWFDQDLTAFKFTLRLGGMPWWSIPAAALAGSNTYSPYVCLGAR
jgi:HK97 family phage major capsid protein